jgi:hypothetical protein
VAAAEDYIARLRTEYDEARVRLKLTA